MEHALMELTDLHARVYWGIMDTDVVLVCTHIYANE